MSNLLWKKMNKKKRKKKWKPKQKQKATGQWKWRKRKKKKKKKKERETWTLLNTAYGKKRKKERTDIFSKIDSTSLHRLKKKEKKTEHFWTVIVILFWLVVKWNFLSLFEFKGDIRNFFFLFILWNFTKTINRGFDTRFINICNYIDSKFFFF